MLQISNSVNHNKSLLRKINPSFKFILFILMVFVIFIPMGFFGQIILFTVIFSMFMLAKLPKSTNYNMLKTYLIMIALFIIINWVTVKFPSGVYMYENGFTSVGSFLNIDDMLWNSNGQYTSKIFITDLYGGNIIGQIPDAHINNFAANNKDLINKWINRIDTNDLTNALNLLKVNTGISDESSLKTLLYMLNNDYKFNNKEINIVRILNLPADWSVKNLLCNPQGVVAYQSTLWTIAPMAIFRSINLANKVMFIILSSTILTATTTPAELTNGIEKIFKPFSILGFPAQQSALILSIGIRFIPSLLQESRRILNAQAARGLDYYNGHLIDKLKSIISLIIPLFTISIKKSEDLANAMDARAYNPRATRTQYQINKVTWKDFLYLFIVFLIATVILFFWINKMTIGAFGIIEFCLMF